MQAHGPKRIYTPKALEFWFAKLQGTWEGLFTEEELERGRRLYRDGEIREIDLKAGDAIIYRRHEKAEDYAVLEWETEGLSVRTSSTDKALGRTIAVAGMLEIEELVAEETPALPAAEGVSLATSPSEPAPATEPRKAPPPAPNGNGAAARPASPNPFRPAPRPGSLAAGNTGPASPAAAASAHASRQLLLSFRAREAGLAFAAVWLEGGKRILAAQPGDPSSHGRSLAERRSLLALAAAVRKARFRYVSESREYLLSDLAYLPEFVRRNLTEWRKQFALEVPDAVQRLAQGPRTVSFQARARATDGGLDLRWIFEAGERLLTAAEAQRLQGRAGTPVLLPDVGLVTLAADKLKSLDRWRRSLAEVGEKPLPRYLIFSLFQEEACPLELSPEILAWKQSLLEPPRSLELPPLLRPYQRRGVEWLAHLGAHDCHGLLADEMGLGKTLQVLSLLVAKPVADRPSIIVCPASVIPVWLDELQKHFPALEVEVLKGNRTFADIHRPVVWLTSYAQLRRQRPLLDVVEFGYAVLDEAQFIKNPDAKVTQACFALRAKHRVALTGTPLENRQLDLWSLFRFLMPGLLGSREGFEAALLTDREGTLRRMRTQIAPFLLRRTKAEVASELPAKVQMDLACPLTEPQRMEYGRICAEGLAKLGTDLPAALRERSFSVFSLLTRLRQVCCDPALLPWVQPESGASGKINVLLERLTEVFAGGHKVVIFSQFVSLLRRLRPALEAQFPGVPLFEITGATLDRKKPVQGFQEATGSGAMLVSLKAAGTGITLHAADYVFLLDPWWNPAVEEQAIDRVHRIGQTQTVFVYRLIAPGTIEERIQSLQAGKRELFKQVVDGIPSGLDLSEHFQSLESLIRLADEPAE